MSFIPCGMYLQRKELQRNLRIFFFKMSCYIAQAASKAQAIRLPQPPWVTRIAGACHHTQLLECFYNFTSRIRINICIIIQKPFSINIVYMLIKRSIYVLWAKYSLWQVLVNKVLLERSHTYLFTYCLWLFLSCSGRV